MSRMVTALKGQGIWWQAMHSWVPACSGDMHLNWLHPISRSSVLRKTKMSLRDCSFTISFVFVGVNYVKMQIVQKQA